MKLNPSVKNQVICKVVNSTAMSNKIVIEVNGVHLEADKISGVAFEAGEYVFLKSFIRSGLSLVVPLSKNEKRYYKQEIALIEERSIIRNFENLKKVEKENISDFGILRKIKVAFHDKTPTKDSEAVLKDIFSVVAVQDESQFDKIKTDLYAKADEAIQRKFIKKNNNTEVYNFLIDMIFKINSKQDHFHFFKAIYVYLKKLKGLQSKNIINRLQMMQIFHPIYNAYVRKFEEKYIYMWVNRTNVITI